MKDKTYRVDFELTEKARELNIEYFKETGIIISERNVINALISAGLKKAKAKEKEKTKAIQEYMDSKEK